MFGIKSFVMANEFKLSIMHINNFVFGLFGNIEVVAGSELVVYAGFGKSLLRKVGI